MSFDTIRFKVLNLSKYEQLGYSLVRGERITLGGMKYRKFTNRLHEVKEDEYVKAKLTSASYEINFDIFLDRNEVLFEFSIPKYIYGHNLEMYPPSPGDEYQDFKNFLIDFFLHEFKLVINVEDIEILRIDFCHNYSFQTIENKEAYKAQVPNLFKSQFGEHITLSYSENDTVMYKTRDYSFKIYDKGKEFMKHDYKRILRIYGRERADELAEKASYILRSELTFRKRKISYEFFSNIDATKQVSFLFKTRFKLIKTDRDNCENLLSNLANRLNRIVTVDNRNEQQRSAYVNEIKNHKNKEGINLWQRYSASSFDHLILVAEKIRDEKKVSFKQFTTTDLTSIIKKHHSRKMAEYTKITSPKTIRLCLSSLERAVNRGGSFPQQIELDFDLMNLLLGKFRAIFKEINNFKPTKVTPLQVLHYNRTLLEENGIKYQHIKKYLDAKRYNTDLQMIKKGTFSRRTIDRYKQTLREIDDILKQNDIAKSIYTVKLNEKMELNS